MAILEMGVCGDTQHLLSFYQVIISGQDEALTFSRSRCLEEVMLKVTISKSHECPAIVNLLLQKILRVV